jgi:predicted dehydrogenase
MGTTVTNHPIRFAVVGCGRMGRVHTDRLNADDRSVVVAVCDKNTNAAQQLRDERAAEAAVLPSLSAVIESDVDAVVIATPTASHYQQILEVVASGRHVLAEKPLARTRQEIQELIALTESHPDSVCVLGYQRRFWRNYRFLREQIQSGTFGQIVGVTFVNCERWEHTIKGTWRDDPASNFGGFLGDAGSHKLDAVLLQPKNLFARCQSGRSQVEVSASVTGIFEDDIPFTLAFTGNAHHYYEELLINCENADLILRNDEVFIAREDKLSRVGLPENESGPKSIANPVSGMLDVLVNGAENPSPFSCALPVLDITQAVLESSTTGIRSCV